MGELKLLPNDHIPPAKLPPSAPELERAVIGACLFNGSTISDVADLLPPQAFYQPQHSHLWTAMLGLYRDRAPIDILTVTQECKRRGTLDMVGGALYISQLTNNISGTSNTVYHAHIVLQNYIGREAIRIGNDLMMRAYEDGTDVFDLLAGAGSEIRILNEHGVKQARSMADILPEVVDNQGPDRALCSGFDAIDGKLRFEPGTVTIIGARPAMGKTAFMLSSAWRQTKNGHRPYVVQMEMKDRNLATRLICGECGIPVWKAKRKMLNAQELDLMAQWHITHGEPLSRLLVDETASMRVSALAARLDRAKRRESIDMVWIDYIGLLQPSEKQRPGYDRMTAISNELRVLAKEIDLPFAVLAQLSRPPKGTEVKPPKLTDLRDSGEIEQDAEAVAFLHRPKYYDAGADDSVQFIIAKNRDGEDGFAELEFDGQGIRMIDRNHFEPVSIRSIADKHIEPNRDINPF